MEKKLSSKYIHMYMSISRVFIRLTGNVLRKVRISRSFLPKLTR